MTIAMIISRAFSLTMLVILILTPITVQSAEIAHGNLRASVVREGGFYHLQGKSPAFYRTLQIDTRLLILQDGLYAQASDGELTLIAETRSVTDHDWQALKDQLESFTVEPQQPAGDVTLAHQLALRAELDSNPQTALQSLLQKGIRVRNARDITWEFSIDNHEHVARATDTLRALANAVAKNQIRVAGSASKLLLGFVPTSPKQKAPLLWPRDPTERLYLAPKSASRHAFSNEAIGGRLLIGQPRWFDPLPSADEVACLPFGGCGYIPATAVTPVRSIWIAFNRKNLKPEVLVVE